MLFNSVEFFIFLPIVLAVYYAVNLRVQNVCLLIASLVFYGWWDYRFLILLGISTVVDYSFGLRIARTDEPRLRRWFLLVSVVVNLGILGFFKYFNFFVESSVVMLQSLGLNPSVATLHIILPVGISFYTFQTMSYTIDVYRRTMEPCRSLLNFALYVSFFPQLVAGPIERADSLLPQLERKRSVRLTDLRIGSWLILLGLFKKVGIADVMAPLVDARFSYPQQCSGPDLLFALYLFAIQIYCDFAGYTDIARGTAKILGIDLVLNFRQPYLATSITQFWRRWHISLSTWLRDYLYIPLGGNRKGIVKTYRNLMLTMLLGGLWHGAAWTFVIWGGLHGMYLAVEKFLMDRRWLDLSSEADKRMSFAARALRIVFVFHMVCLTWVFFRANSFSAAWAYLGGIVTMQPEGLITPLSWTGARLTILLLMLLVIELLTERADTHEFILRWPAWVRGSVYASLAIVILCWGGIDAQVPFIYFQF